MTITSTNPNHINWGPPVLGTLVSQIDNSRTATGMDGTLHIDFPKSDFLISLLVSDFGKSVWSVPSIPVAVLGQL
jgi:hypothetical protein